MSPQFVDFNGDGRLDIVAGIFDGSPHVAFGTDKGWKQPEQILDRDGQRIMLNMFWNFDTKKWDESKDDSKAGGRDYLGGDFRLGADGDGVLPATTVGPHWVRRNEARRRNPRSRATPRRAGDADRACRAPGATMRVFDWDRVAG
jgi:hypothetical protein